MKRRIGIGAIACVACVAGFGIATPAHAAVLYDGSLGTAVDAQGWTYAALGTASATVEAGGTTFNTTAGGNSTQAGYARADQTLDAATGFTLRFDVQVLGELHSSTDRAGFSLVVVGKDPTKSLELGLWTDEVWAQNDSPLFTHGEGASVNTTDAVHQYELAVAGGAYTLSIDGTVQLSGSMRDYTAFSVFFDVYETPNFLFLGDDTTSAQGSVLISRVELTAVPEPSAAMVLVPAALALVRRRG